MERPTILNTLSDFNIFPLDFSVLKRLDPPSLLYYSRFPVIMSLQKIFGDKSESFFTLFAGVTMELPDLEDQEAILQSHVPEVVIHFGSEKLEALYATFGVGAKIKIPTVAFVLNVLTDISLYLSVKGNVEAKRKTNAKKLASEYNVPPAKIHWAYKRIMQELAA